MVFIVYYYISEQIVVDLPLDSDKDIGFRWVKDNLKIRNPSLWDICN